MIIGDDFTNEKLLKYAYKIDQEATLDCRYIGTDSNNKYDTTNALYLNWVELASEVLEK